MIRNRFPLLSIAFALLLTPTAHGQNDAATDDLKPFPAAKDGQLRMVIRLPEQEDESSFRVELIVGKTVRTDPINRYFIAGKIEESIIEGWGFPRFDVKALGPMAGTLIGVDPNEPNVDRFVTLGGEPFLIRYNSRLPIVVYLPEGAELRYRIWTAGETKQARPDR